MGPAPLTVGTYNQSSIYRLIAPSTSSQTVHATWANSHDERALGAVGIQDALQSYLGTIVSATGTDTTLEATATTPSGALTLGVGTWQDGGLDLTITAGQTSILEIEGTDNTYNGLLLEYTTSGGSTQQMTATLSGTPGEWGAFAFAVPDYASDTAPIVQAHYCTESGNNTNSTSWAVAYEAFAEGDLILFHVASDGDVTHDWPATGPNGEDIVTIKDSIGGTAQRASGFYFIGEAATGAGSITVTPSATEQWSGVSLKVPAGTFDATTPIQTNMGEANDTSADTSWATPAWTSDSTANGRIICFASHDVVTTTGIPAGWGELSAVDVGVVGHTLAFRDLPNSASESISSVNFAKVSETDSSFGYIINAPSGGYTMACANGNYTLTGQTATLTYSGAAKSIAADQGSYTLTGQAMTMTHGYRLVCAQGSYALTGSDALVDYAITCAAGSYALTGQSIGIAAARTLALAQGSYALTGQAMAMAHGYRLVAEQGAYELTGQDVTLEYSPTAEVLNAEQGIYSLSGQLASLVVARKVALEQGSYALTGQDAGLIRSGYNLACAQGTYSLSGQDVGMNYSGTPAADYWIVNRRRRRN